VQKGIFKRDKKKKNKRKTHFPQNLGKISGRKLNFGRPYALGKEQFIYFRERDRWQKYFNAFGKKPKVNSQRKGTSFAKAPEGLTSLERKC